MSGPRVAMHVLRVRVAGEVHLQKVRHGLQRYTYRRPIGPYTAYSAVI